MIPVVHSIISRGIDKLGKFLWKFLKLSLSRGYNVCQCAYSSDRNCRGGCNKKGGGDNLVKILRKCLKLSQGMGYDVCQCAYLGHLSINQATTEVN